MSGSYTISCSQLFAASILTNFLCHLIETFRLEKKSFLLGKKFFVLEKKSFILERKPFAHAERGSGFSYPEGDAIRQILKFRHHDLVPFWGYSIRSASAANPRRRRRFWAGSAGAGPKSGSRLSGSPHRVIHRTRNRAYSCGLLPGY